MQITENGKLIAKGALWGAAAGAVLLAFVGFNWGGWHTAGATQKEASEAAQVAVAKVVAPICAAEFAKNATAAQLASFKAAELYGRGDIVAKVVTLPGVDMSDYSLNNACADAIAALSQKSASK